MADHGTRQRYAASCRCDACKAAHAAYFREYRQRDGAKVARRVLRKRRYDEGKDNAVWDEKRRAAYQKRRAQKKSNTRADKVLAGKVYERDGWVCGICEELVDSTLAYPDPMSVSLDHVVPLSLGGEHTEANTRCSHLRCNIRRGNRMEEVA